MSSGMSYLLRRPDALGGVVAALTLCLPECLVGQPGVLGTQLTGHLMKLTPRSMGVCRNAGRCPHWRPVTETGFRTEKYAVYVWRSVREDGDTTTELSRRTLEIPDEVASALQEHHTNQARQRLIAGGAWQDNDLVFASGVGTALDAANVRRSFRRITKAAGLGANWTPRELRHSFVSIMSDNGVTIERIADLVGHRTTIVTQKVYRHQLRPVISTGATTMNAIFNRKSA